MKRELIFTFCCLLITLVWSQEYQRTETGIKASIFGKKRILYQHPLFPLFFNYSYR